MLIQKQIPTNMNEWSRNIVMVETDFLQSDRTMVVAASADLQTKQRLSAELEREHGHKEFLFRQRPTVGKIILLAPSLTQEEGKYLCFMVTRVKQFDRVLITDLHKCLRNLRAQIVMLRIEFFSLPMVDRGREE